MRVKRGYILAAGYYCPSGKDVVPISYKIPRAVYLHSNGTNGSHEWVLETLPAMDLEPDHATIENILLTTANARDAFLWWIRPTVDVRNCFIPYNAARALRATADDKEHLKELKEHDKQRLLRNALDLLRGAKNTYQRVSDRQILEQFWPPQSTTLIGGLKR